MAVGCSHGHMIDSRAEKAVLEFREKWQPDTCIHLGDFLDLTCFRSGSAGTNDEAADPRPDVSHGLIFLERLRPNVVLCGNHEDRLWRLRDHPKAIVATLADCIIKEIERTVAACHGVLIPYDFKAQYQLADCAFLHGWVFSENAIRDTAESYAPQGGAVVFAHSHRAGMARGRRADNPLAFNTGTLMDPLNAAYAKARRATLSWSQGLVWGEYTDTETVLWLHDAGQKGIWRLPV